MPRVTDVTMDTKGRNTYIIEIGLQGGYKALPQWILNSSSYKQALEDVKDFMPTMPDIGKRVQVYQVSRKTGKYGKRWALRWGDTEGRSFQA